MRMRKSTGFSCLTFRVSGSGPWKVDGSSQDSPSAKRLKGDVEDLSSFQNISFPQCLKLLQRAKQLFGNIIWIFQVPKSFIYLDK
jgi:hypothetical protein